MYKLTKNICLILCTVSLVIGMTMQTIQAKVRKEPYQATEFKMGTYVSLRVYDEGKEAVLDDAFALVDDLAAKVTSNDPGSEIDAINQAAGKEAVVVSDEVFKLIESAYHYASMPKSGFDLTIGPITNLWRIGFDDARVPKEEEIEAGLALVDYNKLKLDADKKTVFLTEEGMKLDLGAIAKGFIADSIKQLFVDKGVTTAIIDLGGNVVIMGDSPKRENGGFNVGVQDPINDRGDFIGTINLKDQSIVTSGIYERYLTYQGKTYHHLMNPETGYPFENELLSVTVITDMSLDADALSTVGFGFGLEDGLAFFNEKDNVEAVFITKDLDVYTTDGLKELFVLTNDNFNWVNPK